MKKEIKASLITTIKNEENSIEAFLESLEVQSLKPHEIIIVDGGSIDNSVTITEKFAENSKLNIKIITKKDVNIAEGRNIAISNSKNEIIAITDAGCKLDKNWLKYIVQPFGGVNDVGVVAGWYEPYATTDFGTLAGELFYQKLERVKRNSDAFLPSSRSLALKKECWASVGGYPENLETAEDTLFDIKLKEKGFKFVFVENAIVFWEVRHNLMAIAKQYFRYRGGDAKANLFFPKYWIPRYISYTTGILLVILGFYYPFLFIVLLIFTLLYLGGYTLVVYRKKRIKKAIIIVPALILTSDISGMLGYTLGAIERILTHLD